MEETKIETVLCVYCGAYHRAEIGKPPFSAEFGTYIVDDEDIDEPVCESCVLEYKRLMENLKYKRLMGIKY